MLVLHISDDLIDVYINESKECLVGLIHTDRCQIWMLLIIRTLALHRDGPKKQNTDVYVITSSDR